MRKQYHLRPSKKGFLAWDIDKLIEQTKELPSVDVELDTIKEIDENYWYQGSDDVPTCRSFVEHFKLTNEADLRHPIILDEDGRIMDGMHRVAKALLSGHETIKAVQLKEYVEPDFIDVGVNDLPYD